MSEKKPIEYARYVTSKIDVEVLRRARAYAQLNGLSLQDWLSDLINVAASRGLNMEPIKRKSNKPHPKRPGK